MSAPISDLLAQLNMTGEDARIEAKSLRQVGKAALETVCAFANETDLGGGYLLLGLEWDETRHQYVVGGVADPEKLTAEFASQCASTFNQPVRPYLWTEIVDDRAVVACYIPEAQRQEKPLYFRNVGLPRGAFRRIGCTDHRCTNTDLARFYQEQLHGSYDETPLPDATEQDFEPRAIAAYRRFRREADPNAEELSWTDTELLSALGCTTLLADKTVPTVAGILLFGTRLALRRYFPMMRVDYIRVPGREWIGDAEPQFATVELRDPLLLMLGRIQATILDDLPKTFSLPAGQMQRVDIPAIPERVIREVAVNAVMHRSYLVHGATQIIRYANRLEVRNHGHSLVADDELGLPGSKTRNPRLAAILHETKFAETKGSGIRVMREQMAAANLSPPTFISDRGRDEFVATLLLHHFLDAADIAWLAQFQEAHLSDNEALALIFIREAGTLTNSTYRHLTGVDAATARNDLLRLCRAGLLTQQGSGFATFYAGTPKLLTFPANAEEFVREASPTTPPTPPGTLQTSDKSSELTSMSSELDGLSSELAPMSSELAQAIKALGRRPRPAAMRHVIRRLCAAKPMLPGDLALLLDRNTDYLQQRYLSPMVQAGELVYLFPDQPTHPQQAYRTPTPGEVP